jgi:hypothetical protein
MRYWQYMAYYRGACKIVVFGELPSYDGNLGDAWLYDYTDNQLKEVISEFSSSIRQTSSMVYEESIGRIALFGGFENGIMALNETGLFDTEVGD